MNHDGNGLPPNHPKHRLRLRFDSFKRWAHDELLGHKMIPLHKVSPDDQARLLSALGADPSAAFDHTVKLTVFYKRLGELGVIECAEEWAPAGPLKSTA